MKGLRDQVNRSIGFRPEPLTKEEWDNIMSIYTSTPTIDTKAWEELVKSILENKDTEAHEG